MTTYNGNGYLSSYAGDTISISYAADIELTDNGTRLARFSGQVSPEDLIKISKEFTNEELDFRLEGGRSISGVTIDENGKLSFIDGQIIGFNDPN
jgi:hypothetical protein